MTKQKIAYIGTGAMGKQHIYKLLKDGYQVQVYDKYPEAAKTVIAAGAVWKDSPKEVAQGADLVITNLPLPHHVLENMLGETGAVEGMRPGATWMDFSTTDYHNTQHIAKEAAKKGLFSLESPVSNLSHMGVDFCNASFYVSGDREGYDLSKETLDAIGKISFFVSNTIGEAQTVKLLTNLLFYTAMVTAGEVYMICKVYGIPLLWMWDYIRASQGNSFVTEQVSPFIFDGSYDYSCSLEITVKDTDLTVKLADELNVPLPLGRIVEERYREAGQKYDAHDNHVKVTKLIEEDNNLDLRVPDFTASSPYGLDRSYVHSEERVTDSFGRIKPLPYQLEYTAPEPLKDENLMDIAQSLTDFMAYINYLILGEANQLGKNMGLTDELLVDVIRWSCGTSWVFDNIDAYQPHPEIVEKIKSLDFGSKVKLPVIKKFLAYLSI
ncbi:NAD(P)-dependent oxidoreductase [Moorena sp. SIO4G3]|uniref:NAD(P)-dependent oxidoreductase n=1 Tax=Moorena sp. SIO4G3 TaxID=2607821 RepID=UPI00142B1372|nr:NAD(P)-dependent oxidoreductase [Moorena sp. SIO4G3]NEO75110.1 NAD(P)-dependent oxidoreductase [Moorena sp. SIO4G3]